jgi:hypothetical protein
MILGIVAISGMPHSTVSDCDDSKFGTRSQGMAEFQSRACQLLYVPALLSLINFLTSEQCMLKMCSQSQHYIQMCLFMTLKGRLMQSLSLEDDYYYVVVNLACPVF